MIGLTHISLLFLHAMRWFHRNSRSIARDNISHTYAALDVKANFQITVCRFRSMQNGVNVRV